LGVLGPMIKYGDKIRIKAVPTTAAWGGYLSPCGGATTSGCGIGVTIRPDAAYTSNGGDSSGLRDWIISSATGIATGTPVKYGDTVRIKGTASNWAGHDGYMSPCGGSGGDCGINLTLRPEAAYTSNGGDSSKLRDFIISSASGIATGTTITVGDTVRIKGTATNWAGHDGYLSSCGAGAAGCGLNISMRTDASYNANGGDTSKLRDFVLEKGPETFDGSVKDDTGYHNYIMTGNAIDGIISYNNLDIDKWNMIYHI